MDALEDLYDQISPFIPDSFIRTVHSLAYQVQLLIHTLLTNPSDLPAILPSLLSTIALLVSAYFTILSIVRATRVAIRTTIFVVKYGLLAAVLGTGVAYYRGEGAAVQQGLTNILEFFQTPPSTASTSYGYAPPPAPEAQSTAGKIWEKFAAAEKPAKARSTQSKTKSKSKTKGGPRSWSIPPPPDDNPWTRRVMEYALRKVWDTAQTGDWANKIVNGDVDFEQLQEFFAGETPKEDGDGEPAKTGGAGKRGSGKAKATRSR